MANLTRKICTKLYENRSRFVKEMTKRLRCVFRFAVPTEVQLQNANFNFHKAMKNIIQVRWKTFTFLYDKFTQDNIVPNFMRIGRVV